MHETTARALNPIELSHSRYLDALTAFRPESCLSMTAGAAEGGGDAGAGGGQGGQGGAGGGSGDGGGGDAGSSGQGGSQDDGMAVDSQGRKLGYPKDTPLTAMSAEQQAAYWQHQAQKHEGRYRNLAGDRSFDDTKKALDEYERIQKEQMTPAEQALTEAREKGKTEGLASARTETASAIFRAALETGGITGADLEELVSNFNVANYISDDGVETAKITTFAKRFIPSGTDNTQRRRDFGGGQRHEGQPARGAAGRAEAERRFGTKTK